jgi:hypothetical protein
LVLGVGIGCVAVEVVRSGDIRLGIQREQVDADRIEAAARDGIAGKRGTGVIVGRGPGERIEDRLDESSVALRGAGCPSGEESAAPVANAFIVDEVEEPPNWL